MLENLIGKTRELSRGIQKYNILCFEHEQYGMHGLLLDRVRSERHNEIVDAVVAVLGRQNDGLLLEIVAGDLRGGRVNALLVESEAAQIGLLAQQVAHGQRRAHIRRTRWSTSNQTFKCHTQFKLFSFQQFQKYHRMTSNSKKETQVLG